MKLLRALLFPIGLLAAATGSDAATVWDEMDARVDTLTFFNAVNVTLHRATAEVLENATAGAGVEAPLQVRATDRPRLAAQPIVPGMNLPGATPSGLVADGVTPLLVRIASTGTLPAEGVEYDLALQITIGSLTLPGSPQALLKVAGPGAFVAGAKVRLTPAQPEAFVSIGPIQPGQVQPSLGRVMAKLEVRGGGLGWAKGSATFAISRPPVALVHGYNVKNKNWGGGFTSILGADRADGLVIPVGYGIEDGSNTTASLWPLAATLDEALRTQVEAPLRARWAFTRYDAVGHSQGGVLLRMLCSQNAMIGGGTVENAGFPPWRNAVNHYRGRFRRVVTIGSPHAGSTMCELGTQLRAQGVPFRLRYDAAFVEPVEGQVRPESWLGKLLDNLFQPKFRIGASSALHAINAALVCDPEARLHLVRTMIYGGAVPGLDTQFPEDYRDNQFLYYSGLYLDEDAPAVANPNTAETRAPGEIVAPLASDGVVDTYSQIAGGGSNRNSVVVGDLSHALLGDSQTKSADVTDRVVELLDGGASEFGTVTIPPSIFTFMEDRRTWIAALAEAIANAQRHEQSRLYSSGGGASALPSAPDPPPPPSGVTLNFTLQPPAGESPNGPVEWTARVYEPDGVTAPALTLVTSGAFGEQLALTIPAALVGQVALGVRFPSTSGQTVIGTAEVVWEQPAGRTLLGIAVDPPTVQGRVGEETLLTVRGNFNDATTMAIFTSPAITGFQAANPAIAAVDASGRVTLMGVGTTTITATHNGTFTDSVAVTVRDAAPTVVTPALITGTVGQPLVWQLAASQDVDSFTTDALPPGLTLDTESGLIDGTPTAEGRTVATLTVENGSGRGSKVMEFVIAGVPGAPTDLGLDAGSVSNGQPVGTVVARLTTVDPNPLDTFTYQLVAGAGSGNNGLFAISGDLLVTAAVLNLTPGAPLTIRVRTTDAGGASYEKPLALAVGQPPTISRQPASQRVFDGDLVTFAVEVGSASPVTFTWLHNGSPVPSGSSRILELTAGFAAAGTYAVVVSNADGSAFSTSADLVVDPVSYGRWASLTFGAESGALVQPDGDHDGDGIPNFLDFAFGVNPAIERGVDAQPSVAREWGELLFKYRRLASALQLNYRIWKSEDLLSWQEYVPLPADVNIRIPYIGSPIEIWEVYVPAPTPKVFFKLEVTEP